VILNRLKKDRKMGEKKKMLREKRDRCQFQRGKFCSALLCYDGRECSAKNMDGIPNYMIKRNKNRLK